MVSPRVNRCQLLSIIIHNVQILIPLLTGALLYLNIHHVVSFCSTERLLPLSLYLYYTLFTFSCWSDERVHKCTAAFIIIIVDPQVRYLARGTSFSTFLRRRRRRRRCDVVQIQLNVKKFSTPSPLR
jgi:hypothetical protein